VADQSWPLERLKEALEALGRFAGLARGEAIPPAAGPSAVDDPSLDQWLLRQASVAGVETQAVTVGYSELRTLLTRAAPDLLRVPAPGGPRFLLLTGVRGDQLHVLGPDLKVHAVPREAVVEALLAPHLAEMPTDVEGCLRAAGIKPRRRARAREALLGQCLRSVAPAAPFTPCCCSAGVHCSRC